MTEQIKCAKIGPRNSENIMLELIRRIERLEATVQELSKARRDASLLEVDRIEREFGLEPRTAELRQRFR